VLLGRVGRPLTRRWGRLLGHRFIQLTHTGRTSGRLFRVVLEVVRYDRATGEVTVTAGFGPGSDWYRNVRAGGPAWVDFGRGARQVECRELGVDEAIAVMSDYERRAGIFRPVVHRVLGALADFEYRGTDDDRRRLIETLPMLALTPRPRRGERGRAECRAGSQFESSASRRPT
jgi:deazaflavin-dependent oxidoreductase (nitroreductase family)